jgi:uncharacterized protein
MQIPSKIECLEMLLRMDSLEHIVAHSVRVCRVALLLVDYFNQNELELDRELVRAGALLHDIAKTRSIETGERHSETGGRWMVDAGYPEVGEIVRQHVKLDHYFDSRRVSEAEIVNYADKRVLHDRVVPMDQRMAYILERYGRDTKRRENLQRLWDWSIEMEGRIFKDIPIGPDEIEADLNIEDFERDMALYRSISNSAERGEKT